MLVNLCAEMVRFGVSDEQIGKTIGREKRAVKNRLEGKVEISADDIKAIRDDYFPFYSLDYLLGESPTEVIPKPSA